MKILLSLLMLAALTASAQIQLLDGTTPHTNSATTAAQISVPSKGWTNVPYATTNYIYITIGDGLPAAATTKLNSNFVYITNQLALALQLPNQINTNWQSAVATQSNLINVVIINLSAVSNNLATTMATVASFPGGQLQNGTVNSNKLDSATLIWLQSMPVPGANLLDNGYGTGSTGYIPKSNGDGTWTWAVDGTPATLNFDSGNITSDGSGNITAASIKANLLDSGYSTGTTDYYAKADGSGGWTWTAWPATLNYDSGTITSDGSGNIIATSIKSGLTDGSSSTGTTDYIPKANGSGGWTWAAADVIADTGGNGGTCVHVKASDNGSDMYIHVTSAGVVTATGSP